MLLLVDVCQHDPETFWTLLHDIAHWEFEIFLMVLFDGIIGGLVWSCWLKKHWDHIHKCRKEKTVEPSGSGLTELPKQES
jgi:hypothetical protein